MVFSVIYSAGLHGIDAFSVRVEVDLAGGQLPGWQMVGLAENAVRESKDRVLTALRNMGYATPSQKVTVNLSPASMRKDGTCFDLPIALGLLACQDLIPRKILEASLFLGELSLDAEVRPVTGVLAATLLAKEMGLKHLFVSIGNAAEASVVDGIEVYGVRAFSELVAHLREPCLVRVPRVEPGLAALEYSRYGDFSEVRGQYHAKRGLEIAAAGAHNILLIGPPGTGKSLLCQRLPTILPPLAFEESLETTKIYSRMGLVKAGESLMSERPFRSPHHSVSNAGLIGGGSYPHPGEISMAHHGVLFLDELPEFKRHVLELLRQPLEEGKATITRSQGSLEFPARFILAAAMNPCPCGYLGHGGRPCVCSAMQARQYQNRLSGPLLDRLDLHIELVPIPPEELMNKTHQGESSADIRARVCRAREIQRARFADENFHVNAHMRLPHLHTFCRLDQDVKEQLFTLLKRDKLSARGYHRLLKVARTIADLAHSDAIAIEHLLEAYQYRSSGLEKV